MNKKVNNTSKSSESNEKTTNELFTEVSSAMRDALKPVFESMRSFAETLDKSLMKEFRWHRVVFTNIKNMTIEEIMDYEYENALLDEDDFEYSFTFEENNDEG